MDRGGLFDVEVVLNGAGFLVAGVVFCEVPCDFGVFGIERVVQVLCVAESDHGNSVGIVDVPTGVGVFAIELDSDDTIGFEATDWPGFEIECAVLSPLVAPRSHR